MLLCSCGAVDVKETKGDNGINYNRRQSGMSWNKERKGDEEWKLKEKLDEKQD